MQGFLMRQLVAVDVKPVCATLHCKQPLCVMRREHSQENWCDFEHLRPMSSSQAASCQEIDRRASVEPDRNIARSRQQASK